MRRLSGVLFLASFGLAVGCGDDGKMVSASDTMTTTTLGPITNSTSSPGTGTETDTTPTTSDGTGTGTATDSTGTDTSEPTTGTTDTSGQVLTTMGPTSDPMTSTTNTSMDTTTDTPCQELMVTLEPVKPNTMLVLDKSGSMHLNEWDHDGDVNTPMVTRWYSLWAVVDQLLTNFDTKFNFGMNLFPSKAATKDYDAKACVVNANVEVPIAPMNGANIIPVLPAQNDTNFNGGTPTSKGMTAALNHLKTFDPKDPRIVILVTDGAANCDVDAMTNTQLFEVYDDDLLGIVTDAYTIDEIPTYVIGIAIQNADSGSGQNGNPDNINPYEKLNELATAGGTAKPGPEAFYSADNQTELAAALETIINSAFSCVIPLESEPFFPDATKVKVGGTTIDKVTDCASENGWKYVDPAPPYTAIELCGTACDQLKISGDADVEYYCTAG